MLPLSFNLKKHLQVKIHLPDSFSREVARDLRPISYTKKGNRHEMWTTDKDNLYSLFCFSYYNSNKASLGRTRMAYNEFSVLLLESLVSLSELVGHQFVLISLLLAGVQLFGQNQQSFFLTLQLSLTYYELRVRRRKRKTLDVRRIYRQRNLPKTKNFMLTCLLFINRPAFEGDFYTSYFNSDCM